jgi:adenine deaminase
MDSALRRRLIAVAAGRSNADLVIRNAHVVDVFSGTVKKADVAVVDGYIAGVGSYSGTETVDANENYLIPGLIDSHVHIESSLVDPASFANLVVPHGTTTVIADPHEICNVCGLDALDYMLEASEALPLDVFFMIPSCVPATPFEHAGAILDAPSLKQRIDHRRILGLGEMMDMVGTIAAEERILEKLAVAEKAGKLIDGHAPGVEGSDLDAYVAAGIHTDHECATPTELQERISRGMYVLLREGSACQDLQNLLPGVTAENAHMCLFCTDDRQPKSILESGHIDNHLRIAVASGLDPILAIRMATLNAAQCFRLHDRGAIAPGLRADMVLVDNLSDFTVQAVFTQGERYQEPEDAIEVPVSPSVSGRVDIGSFSEDSLVMKLESSLVRVIDVVPGSVVTNAGQAHVTVDSQGVYQNDLNSDLVKLAVVERHNGTGNVGLALLRGYGLTEGAIATTIAHDSHNIIVAGDNDADMALAVTRLSELGGGIIMVHNNEVLDLLPLPIAGLMTNKGGTYVAEKFQVMHDIAIHRLKVNRTLDPFMTLSFMALPVIPHLKVTDMGLFDVDAFSFVSLEV